MSKQRKIGRPIAVYPLKYRNVRMRPRSSQGVAPILLGSLAAANALGVSERTLFNITKAGALKCVRIKTRILYRPETLVEFAKLNEGLMPASSAEDEGLKGARTER
jgi:hypothetical protein